MNQVAEIKQALHSYIKPQPRQVASFFKTNPGSYGQHDIFIDVTVPEVRKVAQIYSNVSLEALQELLSSAINQERLLALIILTNQYKNASSSTQKKLYDFYLKNLTYVNNWNLVDSSAHLIMGAYLYTQEDRSILEQLAQSESLWLRRIAMIATWYFIRKKDVTWTLKIAKLLLQDSQDLIHKAAGWMLREAGKQNEAKLITFLNEHTKTMPRTMLRYSLEKFPEHTRKHYMLQKQKI